jgi:DNA helicase-2/ATP-dependent DNA helicase PcrA
MIDLLDGLNTQQQEAVKHIDGPLLILAGAGSGKTKTITTRLAYLIKEVGISPANTLTLTFTNKAAKEMERRALSMIGHDSLNFKPMLCTFHKFGLIFLKKYIDKLGRDRDFNIIDTDDKKRILRKIIKDIKIDLDVGLIASEISKYKNNLLTPEDLFIKSDIKLFDNIVNIYKIYQEQIISNNLVDFDDLLMLPYLILKNSKDLRSRVSKRYSYIMVDEYQDTNELQFRLLKMLTSEHNNLCVVGDDDQSIYGWRGANINNILNFTKEFEDSKLIKLEVNYRSTSQILKVANELIENNKNRVGKTLVSHRGDGRDVRVLHSRNETIEAQVIAKEIKDLIAKGVSGGDIAVLYRINALSRSLEEVFVKEGLKFRLAGGVRFYERAEIKDLVSYFRVISNPDDDFSLERIINKPRRGIGEVSIKRLKSFAKQKNLSIFSYIDSATPEELLANIGKRAVKPLKSFSNDIKRLRELKDTNLLKLVDTFEDIIGFRNYYEGLQDGYDRLLNINEFYGYFNEFIRDNSDATIEDFLNEISLQTDQDYLGGDVVTIMTIHASKGLEFEHVYVIGLEEEFFPLLGNSDIEEERRLGYVAMTRAKSNLVLSYVDSRFYRGQRVPIKRSRFLGESGLVKEKKLQISKEKRAFKKGDLVKHKIFGIGRVQSSIKYGKNYKLNINFGGTKKEILSSFVQAI